MTDTERLDLLVRLLPKYDLGICRSGYTLFGRSGLTMKPIVQEFYPTVRDLLEVVGELNLEEYKV